MESRQIRRELFTLITEAERLQHDLVNYQLECAKNDVSGNNADFNSANDRDEELVIPFIHLATSIYLTTVALLDKEQMHVYLKHFYKVFGKKFNARKAAEEFDIEAYWTGEPFNVFLFNIRQFIGPLGIMQDIEGYLKLSGVHYLETILKNTGAILHQKQVTPKSEVEVYQEVKYVLEAVFPSIKTSKSNFIKTAKQYKPDILISELSVAIEYKYASNGQQLTKILGQIAEDVRGYTGDYEYQLFYAVIYVTNAFWGEDKFKHAWKDHNFPKNWRYFYIVGQGGE